MNLRAVRFAVARRWARIPAAIGAVVCAIAGICWKVIVHPEPVSTWLLTTWAVVTLLAALVGLPAAWLERENMLSRRSRRKHK